MAPLRSEAASPALLIIDNEDACWAMGEGAFEASHVATGLSLRPESPLHGLVEPEYNQHIGEYRGHLAATRDQWLVAED